MYEITNPLLQTDGNPVICPLKYRGEPGVNVTIIVCSCFTPLEALIHY